MAAVGTTNGNNLLPISDTAIGRYTGNGELKVVLSRDLSDSMLSFPTKLKLRRDVSEWIVLFILDWAAYQAILDGGKCDLIFTRYVADRLSLRVVPKDKVHTFVTEENNGVEGIDIAVWLSSKITVTPCYFSPDHIREDI